MKRRENKNQQQKFSETKKSLCFNYADRRCFSSDYCGGGDLTFDKGVMFFVSSVDILNSFYFIGFSAGEKKI